MDPEQQRLELQPLWTGDDHLAVQDASFRQLLAERGRKLGKVAIQRLELAALRIDLVSVSKDERAEAVPFRLEEPAVAGRQRVGELGQHRLEGRFEGESHRADHTVAGRVGRVAGLGA